MIQNVVETLHQEDDSKDQLVFRKEAGRLAALFHISITLFSQFFREPATVLPHFGFTIATIKRK